MTIDKPTQIRELEAALGLLQTSSVPLEITSLDRALRLVSGIRLVIESIQAEIQDKPEGPKGE